jgi:hypothetical protein
VGGVSNGEGLTDSERYLARLCRNSFLRLWSWPNLFRDQRAGSKTEGKELCDLLVAFGRHIFLFSDKYCAYPSTGNPKLDWSRWFRRAVWDGAQQIWGAERWLREHPDRVFCDRACKRPLPICLPPASEALFHRVVVAHGAGERCRDTHGGNGSLMIRLDIIGKKHFQPVEEVEPFVVGALDPARGLVHVMDDFTLGTLLETVDTAADLADYCEAKEQLFTSGRHVWAAGEEELLARYLQEVDASGRHTFAIPDGVKAVGFDEGLWQNFRDRPERLAQIEANRSSYAWDALIDEFTKHILGGTLAFGAAYAPADLEVPLRFMAAENRTQRRALSRNLMAAMKRGQENERFTRVALADPKDPPRSGRDRAAYVFLSLKRPVDVPAERYRTVRRKLLMAHLTVVRGQHASAKHVVGIATEPLPQPGSGEGWHGEDLAYLDGTEWDEGQQAEAERLSRDLNILTKARVHRSSDHEYPRPSNINYAKGRNRNATCPCGSGKKVKRCRHLH